MAALRCEGIDAPCVFDGPINGASFKAYVEQVLAPASRPGDIVVMDNLGSHKGSAIRRAIRAAGARLLFLPTYSSASLRKTQNTHPKSRRAYRRWPLATHRRFARSFHAQRMCQLPPQRRICFYLNLKCSSSPANASATIRDAKRLGVGRERSPGLTRPTRATSKGQAVAVA